MHPLLFRFHPRLGQHRALRRIPWAAQQVLIRYLLVVYICQSQSPNSSHSPIPLLVSYTCALPLCLCFCFANKIIYIIFFRFHIYSFVVVHSISHVRLFATPWIVACQASLSFTISWSLLKLLSIASMMPSNHLVLCCPFLLLPSIFPSIRVFSSESVLCIRWPKVWSFSFSISPSNEYSGLISFRRDWFDLLEAQGTVKSFPQHHSWKASILLCSAFLLSNSHIYTWLLKNPQLRLCRPLSAK